MMSILSLTLVNNVFCQDDWSSPKHGLQLALSEWWMVSDQHYDNEGNLIDNIAEYGYFATTLKSVYGFSDNLAATLCFPFANYVYSKLPLSGQKSSGWQTGDAEIGLRYALLRRPSTSILADLHVGLPFGGTGGQIQPTGDKFDQQLGLMIIRMIPFRDSIGWWRIGAAFHNRHEDYCDELHYALEIGLIIDKDFKASVALTAIKPLGEKDGAIAIYPESLFSNRREVFILTPDVRFNIDQSIAIGLSVDVLLGGKNRLAGTGYEVAIHYRN